MSQIAIRVSNVALTYRKGLIGNSTYTALTDVSFEVMRGETLGVIGFNGAGKSTLLRLLAGIYEPDRGHIELHGNSVTLLSLQVGFVPHLSGRDNAVVSGVFLGMRKTEILSRMDEVLEFTELHEFIDEPIVTYSSGMKARLGFGVALLADPDVLLVDEVLGVGDIEFRKKSAEAMRARIRSNKTVVLVTHSPQTVTDLCDRVVWIHEGVTKMQGSTEEVLPHYLDHYKQSNKN